MRSPRFVDWAGAHARAPGAAGCSVGECFRAHRRLRASLEALWPPRAARTLARLTTLSRDMANDSNNKRPRKAAAPAPGGAVVTLEMVAAAAQVSPSTVSRILNGTAKVSADKKEAVDKAIARLGFRP